jgi:hypothetical protein
MIRLSIALAAILILATADVGEPISGPRVTGANEQTPTCLGAFVETAEVLSDYPQRIERVRIVTLCRGSRYYELVRATAMRVDGHVGQRFSNDSEILCQPPRPEPENKKASEVLRDRE